MLKKILIACVVIYVVVTSTYFVYKYAPYLEKYFQQYFQNGTTEQAAATTEEESAETVAAPATAPVHVKECASYALGHIAINEFRVETRFLASASGKEKAFDGGNLQQVLAAVSCDRSGQKAMIYYDSKPVAIARVESFDYSKPLAEGAGLAPTFYTVLKVEKKFSDFPDNGYVAAVYDYDENKMEFYRSVNDNVSSEDEKLIAGSCNTIYLQVVGTDPSRTDVEYAAIRSPLNNTGMTLLSVLASWTGPDLPKGIHYNAVFNLHIKKDGSAARYPLFPITKMRNSTLFLSQVIDLNNDGYKETIVRKSREGNDTFMIYYYDRDKNTYLAEGDQSGE